MDFHGGCQAEKRISEQAIRGTSETLRGNEALRVSARRKTRTQKERGIHGKSVPISERHRAAQQRTAAPRLLNWARPHVGDDFQERGTPRHGGPKLETDRHDLSGHRRLSAKES